MMTTTSRLIIFAYGNPSRGDDALGPEFLKRLGEESVNHKGQRRYKRITDFQLQIEHAEDLLHRDLALFIDADMAIPPPFSFYRLKTTARYQLYLTCHEPFCRAPCLRTGLWKAPPSSLHALYPRRGLCLGTADICYGQSKSQRIHRFCQAPALKTRLRVLDRFVRAPDVTASAEKAKQSPGDPG